MKPTNAPEGSPFDQQTTLPNVKKVLLVGSGKGGVGKSSISANLAMGLQRQGLTTAILDADIYGPSLPRIFGKMNAKPEINEEKKLHPIDAHGLQLMSIGFLVEEGMAVVWRGPMLFKAMHQLIFDVAWRDVDVLVIDLPPGTGDIQLSLAQKLNIDGGIIVSTPQNLSLIDAKKALDMYERLNIPVLGWIENMAFLEKDGQKIQLYQSGNLPSFLDNENLQKLAQIPFDPALGMACETGLPLATYQKENSLVEIFDQLAGDLKSRLF